MVLNYIFFKQVAIIYFEILKGDRQCTPPGKVFNFTTFFGLDRPQLSF